MSKIALTVPYILAGGLILSACAESPKEPLLSLKGSITADTQQNCEKLTTSVFEQMQANFKEFGELLGYQSQKGTYLQTSVELPTNISAKMYTCVTNNVLTDSKDRMGETFALFRDRDQLYVQNYIGAGYGSTFVPIEEVINEILPQI